MPALSQEFRFRDVFNPRVIRTLADNLKAAWPDFDADAFARDASDGLDALTMNARSAQITDALTRYLPDDFTVAAPLVIEALDDVEVEPGKTHWDGFIVLPQCAWVVQHGLDHFDLSMRALYHLTQRLSAEGYLRALIDAHPERALARLGAWVEDPNPHVRRLVSEGTRSRLPMTGRYRRFEREPAPLIALLDVLRDDPSEYVRRSVANNLNDLSKDRPEVVLDVLERWSEGASDGTRWVIGHALRTLLKAGDARALALVGFAPVSDVEVAVRVLTPRVCIGGALEFEATLTSTSDAPQRLMLDYAVGFVKARGERRDKVFKWTKRTLAPGSSVTLTRRQHMRPTSGRKLYPGVHTLALQLNGRRLEALTFDLNPDALT